jgi:hypothetical protein
MVSGVASCNSCHTNAQTEYAAGGNPWSCMVGPDCFGGKRLSGAAFMRFNSTIEPWYSSVFLAAAIY